MKKWMLFACAVALTTPILPAGAEPGDHDQGNNKARDFLAQGTPPGDYKLGNDKDDHKKPPHPCKRHGHHHDHDNDDNGCGHPASE